MVKRKRTKNDLQNTTQKTKDRASQIHELRCQRLMIGLWLFITTFNSISVIAWQERECIEYTSSCVDIKPTNFSRYIHQLYRLIDLIDFWCFNTTFSNISAISWRPVFIGGRSRRESPTMGKQLVNFITCGCESSAPFFVIYKAGHEHTPYW